MTKQINIEAIKNRILKSFVFCKNNWVGFLNIPISNLTVIFWGHNFNYLIPSFIYDNDYLIVEFFLLVFYFSLPLIFFLSIWMFFKNQQTLKEILFFSLKSLMITITASIITLPSLVWFFYLLFNS